MSPNFCVLGSCSYTSPVTPLRFLFWVLPFTHTYTHTLMSLRTIHKQRICYVGFGVNKSVFTGSLTFCVSSLELGASQFSRVGDKCGLPMRETLREAGWMPGLGRPPEESMVTHSSILTWRTPRTEKSGGLQSIEWQRVRHKWSNLAHTPALTTRTLLKCPWDLNTNCKGIQSSTLVLPVFVIGIYVFKGYTYCTSLTNT